MPYNKIILILTITSVALMAGLFYSFSISVMPALSRTENKTFVEVMQQINRVIINPYFGIAFFGSIIFTIVNVYFQFREGVDVKFYLTIASALIFLIGTIGVTFFGNVPLNNALDVVNIANETDVEKARISFERIWNLLNNIRSISALISLILLIIPLVMREGIE